MEILEQIAKHLDDIQNDSNKTTGELSELSTKIYNLRCRIEDVKEDINDIKL